MENDPTVLVGPVERWHDWADEDEIPSIPSSTTIQLTLTIHPTDPTKAVIFLCTDSYRDRWIVHTGQANLILSKMVKKLDAKDITPS